MWQCLIEHHAKRETAMRWLLNRHDPQLDGVDGPSYTIYRLKFHANTMGSLNTCPLLEWHVVLWMFQTESALVHQSRQGPAKDWFHLRLVPHARSSRIFKFHWSRQRCATDPSEKLIHQGPKELFRCVEHIRAWKLAITQEDSLPEATRYMWLQFSTHPWGLTGLINIVNNIMANLLLNLSCAYATSFHSGLKRNAGVVFEVVSHQTWFCFRCGECDETKHHVEQLFQYYFISLK